MDEEPERTKRWEGGYERTWWVFDVDINRYIKIMKWQKGSEMTRLSRAGQNIRNVHSDMNRWYVSLSGRFWRRMSLDLWKLQWMTFFSRQRGKGPVLTCQVNTFYCINRWFWSDAHLQCLCLSYSRVFESHGQVRLGMVRWIRFLSSIDHFRKRKRYWSRRTSAFTHLTLHKCLNKEQPTDHL